MQMPNAQGIAGLMSQGRAPQQPQPQPPIPSPMKASPMAAVGSVEDRVAAYRGNPAPLQQRYAMSQDLLDLLALQKIKSEKESAARQMQLAMGQQQAAEGADMTIAQQREKEVMDLTKNELAQQRGETAQQQTNQQQTNLQKLLSGIANAPGAQAAAQPKMMASGGIVAFREGGRAPFTEESAEQARELEQQLEEARARKQVAERGLRSYSLLRQRSDPSGYEEAQRTAADAAQAVNALERQYSQATRVPPQMLGSVPAAARELQGLPAPSVSAPSVSAPPVSSAYPEPRGSAAGIAAIPRPPAPPAPAPLATAPAASASPAPRTAPVAPAPAALPKPTMPSVPMIPGLEASISQDVGRDPVAAQLAQEERIRKMYELTPEQRGVYEQGIAQRQRMFEEAYDPERQRREGLKQFLLGAGGRRYGEFGAGAGAGMAYDEAQRAQRQRDFETLQKSREGLVGLEREGIKPAIEGGLKGLEVAGALRRQGQASGTSVLSTASQAATSQYSTDTQSRDKALDREVERARIAAQQAATAVQREGLDFSRMQGHLNTIVTNRARAVEAVQKRYAPQLSMLDMQLQATPNDKKLLQQRDALNLQIEAAVDAVTKDFDDAKASVEARLYGASGAGAGGYTVRKKEPK